MHYIHLTREERYTISCLLSKGHSTSFIATRLERSKSTINREIKRNSSSCGYSFSKAVDYAARRSRKASCRSPRVDPDSWSFAIKMLTTEQWSPDQISADLKKSGRPPMSHETIYQRIYADKNQEGTLYVHLRHRVGCYKSRLLKNDNRGRIKNQRSIEDRPSIVEEKSRVGDIEVDTIVGSHAGSASVLVTLVDRCSRFTLIAKAANKTAQAVSEALLHALAPYREKIHTLTYDNGKEFARHEIIDAILETTGYFAHPYSSWERGLNENTNGLIRQYFPKKTNFDNISESDIALVQDKLNRRPRKCLDRNTPNSIFLSN
jgi:IS30 family transposase